MSELQAVEAFYQSVLGSQPHLPEELLLSAAEERLNARERSRVDAHLAACTRCRQDFLSLCHFREQQPCAPVPALVIAAPEGPPLEPTSEEAPALRVVSTASPEVVETPLGAVTPSVIPAPSVIPTPPVAASAPSRVVLLSGLFLGLSALGWGVLYGKLAPKTPVVASATPLVSSTPSAAPGLAQLQAVYERERAQLRGRVTQLEKQLKAGGGVSTAPTAVTATTPRASTLFPPEKLQVDRPPVSLTVHPIVSWKARPKVHHYGAELVDAKGKALVKTRTQLPEWRITTALARGKSYRWKITPQDRSDKPLGKPLRGAFRVASDEEAKRVHGQLVALASELGKLNFIGDAQALKARAAMLLKK